MSSGTQPISPARFADALKDLPVSSLNGKAAELRNSIAHLQSSNDQLQEFAAAGDADCADAIRENQVVVRRMEERIALLRAEVESRGLRWYEDHADEVVTANGSALPNGHTESTAQAGETSDRSAVSQRTTSGRLTDEELRRALTERLGEDSNEDDGVHL